MILALDRLWLNLWSTGEVLASAQTINRGGGFERTGDVITLANGRQVFRGQAGEKGTFTTSLRSVSLATVAVLRAHEGQLVQARDHRGQRWLGVFTGVEPVETRDPTEYDARITIRVVTVDEG
jgi:hypothetical protein